MAANRRTRGDIRTRRGILDLLKRGGAQTAAELAAELEVTPAAVRQHLQDLQAEKLVVYAEEARSVGRPVKLWRLTAAAETHFPDAHAELAVGLIAAMKASMGEAGLERMLAAREQALIASYGAKVKERKTLAARVGALARQRTAEGYMAEVGRADDGAWLLVENHCPICAAAATCQGLCRIEQTVFAAVLGPEVTVERTEHILLGARRCAYRIVPRAT